MTARRRFGRNRYFETREMAAQPRLAISTASTRRSFPRVLLFLSKKK